MTTTWTTIETHYPGGLRPLAILGKLSRELLEIYGTYCETRSALSQLKKELTRELPKDISVHWRQIFFGRKGPALPHQHSRLMTELIERLGEEGPNAIRLRQSSITVAYSVWEHGIRPDLIRVLGGKDVTSDVFGDLRRYRQAIAHVDGVLDKATSVLTFVNVGEKVTLTDDQFYELFKILVQEVNVIALQFFGHNPQYSLDSSRDH